jgi:hypothetical protein
VKKGYDVISRPAGGMQIVGSVCVDGLVHLFGLLDGVRHEKPACGAKVAFGKPSQGHEPMCLSCSGRAEAWAMGGSLGAPGNES